MILEGIFNATRYEPMLGRVAGRAADARFYSFDLAFEETVRRHRLREKATAFTADEMQSWYHGWQPLSFIEESRIGSHETVTEIVDRILGSRPISSL